jgi:hypothetical protein
MSRRKISAHRRKLCDQLFCPSGETDGHEALCLVPLAGGGHI